MRLRRADGGLELPPKVAQERLGYASIAMTLDVTVTYSCVVMTSQSWTLPNKHCSVDRWERGIFGSVLMADCPYGYASLTLL